MVNRSNFQSSKGFPINTKTDGILYARNLLYRQTGWASRAANIGGIMRRRMLTQ